MSIPSWTPTTTPLYTCADRLRAPGIGEILSITHPAPDNSSIQYGAKIIAINVHCR